jgi:hypothetical protein
MRGCRAVPTCVTCNTSAWCHARYWVLQCSSGLLHPAANAIGRVPDTIILRQPLLQQPLLPLLRAGDAPCRSPFAACNCRIGPPRGRLAGSSGGPGAHPRGRGRRWRSGRAPGWAPTAASAAPTWGGPPAGFSAPGCPLVPPVPAATARQRAPLTTCVQSQHSTGRHSTAWHTQPHLS